MVENCGRPWSTCKQLLGIARGAFAHVLGKRLIDVNPVVGIDLVTIKSKQPAIRSRVMLMKASEIALNHKLPGIEGIYDVREEIPERRAAMEAWARFIEGCCDGKDPQASDSAIAATNVVPFKRRAAA
jgi:hypothetical protein